MTVNQIITQARRNANAFGEGRYPNSGLFLWLDEAQRLIVKNTGCLMNSRAVTAINNGAGYAQGATSIIVDDARYFRVGDKIDIIDEDEAAATRKKSMGNTISAINHSTQTLTVSALDAACQDNDDVFFHNDLGYIDTVASQENYDAPWSALEVLQVESKSSATDRYRALERFSTQGADVSNGYTWNDSGGALESSYPDGWYSRGAGAGTDFVVFPAPSAAVTDGLFVQYQRRPLRIVYPDQTPEIDEAYHAGLEAYLSYKLLMADRQVDLAMPHLQMFQATIGQGQDAMQDNRAPMQRG